MDTILGVLAESSVRAAAIAAAMACVLWGMRVKSPAFRHRAWTGVLVAMLFLPFLSLWAPRISIPLPEGRFGSSIQQIQSSVPKQSPSAKFEELVPAVRADPDLSGPIQSSAPAGSRKESLPKASEIAAALYIAGFFVLMIRLLLGMLLSYRLFRQASRDRRDFCFAGCAVPLTVGLLRPRIVLPVESMHWDEDTLASVLIHEQEHVRRRDPLVEWLALLNRSIYWFHPLAWWLCGKVSSLAEQTCDEAVIASGRDRGAYVELLLKLALSLKKKGALLANWGSSIHGSTLRERIHRILAAVQSPALSRARRIFTTVFCVFSIIAPATCALVPAQEHPLSAFNSAAPSLLSYIGLNSQDRFAVEIFDNPVVQWIANHAVRLKTPEAGHGFADMQPLKKVVGDARIVALGEATHGTREFFQLKHRMLEFLATEMGFSIFSIEANMPEAYRLNDFVLNGRGDPASLIKGMYFWTWDTQEVLDMVLWMREFNKSGKGRLQFTGFDMQTPDVAMRIVNDFVAEADPAYADSLHHAMDMARNANPAASNRNFGVATGTFPVKDAAGKRVRFSGYIKTENVTTGYAGLWWRVDGPSGSSLAFDNMQGRGATGTTDWKRFEIELPVAPEANNINFGALFPGDGTAWFDELTVELDGKPYVNKDLFDFDFESPSPKGFYTGGDGYKVQLDTQVFHNGHQSLRMTKAPVVNNSKAVDPAAASSTWREIVGHMESAREGYQKKGIALDRIDWAIQNARVVRQCMQMQAKEVLRDDSMAENVKWILDQNPGAKVVLWAHNGHVFTKSSGGYGPMGASLRRMYDNQMVVFGFAFNQGSFQAFEPGKTVHDFTVPPAPDGSLDATFAATGIPLFALDLRTAPKAGPVAEWFNQPHQARSIGASFSDSTAAQYLIDLNAPQSFDAVLFVEKTTAARKTKPVSFLSCQGGDQFTTSTVPRECRDPEYKVQFTLPAGWKIAGTNHFGDQETNVGFSDPQSQLLMLWYRVLKPEEKMTSEEIVRALTIEMNGKSAERANKGFQEYRIRPESSQARSIDGRPALTCIADFVQDGKNMVEYLTWIRSSNTFAEFFGRLPASDLDRYRGIFDHIAETLQIP